MARGKKLKREKSHEKIKVFLCGNPDHPSKVILIILYIAAVHFEILICIIKFGGEYEF